MRSTVCALRKIYISSGTKLVSALRDQSTVIQTQIGALTRKTNWYVKCIQKLKKIGKYTR